MFQIHKAGVQGGMLPGVWMVEWLLVKWSLGTHTGRCPGWDAAWCVGGVSRICHPPPPPRSRPQMKGKFDAHC
jgi:hypothetical protein